MNTSTLNPMETETTNPGAAAQLSVGAPARVTTWTVLIISLYGLLLGIPVLISMMVVSVLPFNAQTILIPLITFAAATFFLPLGFGNPHIRRLVNRLHPGAGRSSDGFIVQLSLSPRIESGLRGLLEDADDFGLLSFTGSELRFEGDSINARIPFQQIQNIERKSIGWRGLFLCKQRVAVTVRGLPGTASLEFAERSSWILPASRSATNRLFERFSALVQRG